MKSITKTRLKLIIAKAELLLANDNSWHDDVSSAISEIVKEAQLAANEVRNDNGWSAGDR